MCPSLGGAPGAGCAPPYAPHWCWGRSFAPHYAHASTCMCLPMYGLHTYMSPYVCGPIYVPPDVHMCVYMHLCVCPHVCIPPDVCACVYTWLHMYVPLHVCASTCVCIHMYVIPDACASAVCLCVHMPPFPHIRVSVCPHFCLSVSLYAISIRLCVRLSHFLCLFVCTSPFLYVCRSVCANMSPFLCLYVPISIHLCVRMSPFLSVCPHFRLYAPISVCMSPFQSIYGSARLSQRTTFGVPPPKSHGWSTSQQTPPDNPHPNPSPHCPASPIGLL